MCVIIVFSYKSKFLRGYDMRKLLIVDDERIEREGIKMLLKNMHFPNTFICNHDSAYKIPFSVYLVM